MLLNLRLSEDLKKPPQNTRYSRCRASLGSPFGLHGPSVNLLNCFIRLLGPQRLHFEPLGGPKSGCRPGDRVSMVNYTGGRDDDDDDHDHDDELMMMAQNGPHTRP